MSNTTKPRRLPRCPVAEFSGLELDVVNPTQDQWDRVYQARAQHLRDYQEAKAEGRALPNLFDYLPTAEEMPLIAASCSWLRKD
jgi:hypothetical protein